MRKYGKTTILLALCLAFTVLCAVCLIACNSVATTPFTQKATTFVSLEINPSIQLVLDQNDSVMSVEGINEDAKVLLFREDGIVGANIKVATENIAALAVEYGYLTSDNSTVDLCVVSGTDDKQNDVLKKVSFAFSKGAQNKNASIDVKIEEAISLSVNAELQKLKAQFPDDENIQNLSVGRLNLINRVIDKYPTLTPRLLASKSTEELIAKIAQSDADLKYGEEYKSQVDKAKLIYDNTAQTLEGGLYVSHFAKKTLNSYKTGNLPSALENLTKTESAIKYTVANAYLLSIRYYQSRFADYLNNPTYTISDEVKNSLAAALGVSADDLESGINAVEAEQGVCVSQKDIVAYIDKLYRNAQKDGKEIISAVYGDLFDKFLCEADKDSADISFSADCVEDAIEDIRAKFADAPALSIIGFNLDSVLNDCKPDVDYDNESSLNDAATRLETLKTQAYEDMSTDDEDLSQIEASKAELQSILDSYLAKYNQAKDAALKDATERLSAMKESRKPQNIR